MLNAAYVDARSRYAKPKERLVWTERTPFQSQLERNAFAKALISPVRRCSMTGVCLPRHFLQPFTCSTEGLEEKDAGSTKNIRLSFKAAAYGEPRRAASLSTYTYASLDRQILAILRKQQRRGRLLDISLEEQLKLRLGRKLKNQEATEILMHDDPLDATSAILARKVQSIAEVAVRNEKPLRRGGSRARLNEVGVIVTFGATLLHSELLSSGLMHYCWDGHPPAGANPIGEEDEAGQTFGFVSTERSTKLAMALDRLFTFRGADKQPNPQAKDAAQKALQNWLSSLSADP